MSKGATNISHLSIGDEVVLKDGTIVSIVRKGVIPRRRTGDALYVCEDNCLNEADLRASDIVKGKAVWPFKNDNINKFKAKVGARELSLKDGYYVILKQEDNRVLVQWENTGRLAYVSIAFVGNGTVKDAVEGYYVYAATHNNEIVYIGKGKESRYLHCASGSSHVYELNKLHFSGELVEVAILKDALTDTEATKLEREMIEEVRPAFNKVYLNNSAIALAA